MIIFFLKLIIRTPDEFIHLIFRDEKIKFGCVILNCNSNTVVFIYDAPLAIKETPITGEHCGTKSNGSCGTWLGNSLDCTG